MDAVAKVSFAALTMSHDVLRDRQVRVRHDFLADRTDGSGVSLATSTGPVPLSV